MVEKSMEHGQTNQMSRKSQCQNQAHGDTDYKEELERSLQVKDTKLKMEKHQKLTQFHGNIVDTSMEMQRIDIHGYAQGCVHAYMIYS